MAGTELQKDLVQQAVDLRSLRARTRSMTLQIPRARRG